MSNLSKKDYKRWKALHPYEKYKSPKRLNRKNNSSLCTVYGEGIKEIKSLPYSYQSNYGF